MNVTHMADNLAAISAVHLSAAEMQQLSTRPLDYCSIDKWYECVPDAAEPVAPPSPFVVAAATRA